MEPYTKWRASDPRRLKITRDHGEMRWAAAALLALAAVAAGTTLRHGSLRSGTFDCQVSDWHESSYVMLRGWAAAG